MAYAAQVLAAGLLVLGVTGCKSVTKGAKEHFSQDFTCPMDRVEVRERPDIRPSDLEPALAPPKDIAADPQRLKMWQAQQDESRAYANSSDTMLEARGCDHQTLYACHRHNKDSTYVMCSRKPYPPATAKW
jgi:hypothetical protein